MRFAADDPGNVSLTRGIVGQHDVAGIKRPYDASARLDFPGAGKRYYELAPRRGMALEHAPGEDTAENGARGGSRVGGENRLIAAEFNFDFFKV